MDNKLYSVGEENNRAKFIGDLSLAIREKPVRFHAGKKYLWLITNNSLYKINPANAAIRREIGLIGSNAERELGKKIDFRSIYENDESLLLGTRNYLLRVKLVNNGIMGIDSIPTSPSARVDFSNLYITDISGQYFASMQHGIFELNAMDSLEKIPGSDAIGEIRRFIEEDNRFIYLYTSKGVYEWGKYRKDFRCFNRINPKSVSTVYYGNKSSYIIGYRGIERIPLDSASVLHRVDKHLDITVNEAAIAEVADKSALFIGAPIGLYKYSENNDLTLIEIPLKNYTVLHLTLSIAGIAAIIIIVILLYFHRKRQIKRKLRRCEERIMENVKKGIGNELKHRREELDEKLKSVNILGILRLEKEVNHFVIRVEESLLKRNEIVDSIKILISSKIKEIDYIIGKNGQQDEWEDIRSGKDKIGDDRNDEYSIDYSLGLLERILEFERNCLKKSMITQQMTESQKKDFEDLNNIFIIRKESKPEKNEPEKGGKQTGEEEKRNRIKSKCEELLNKYHEELGELKLKSNAKKTYVALLLISGKFDNADIEETMNFNRVGDVRYIIHEELKQKTNRNALLEQLFENTKPKK
jgi:hypothetical protein